MTGSGGRKDTPALLLAIEAFYGEKGPIAAAHPGPPGPGGASKGGSRPAAPHPKVSSVLVVCGGGASAAELLGCLAGLGSTDKIRLGADEDARFAALSAAGQVDPASLGPALKKLDQEKSLVQKKMPGKMSNGGLVCFVKAPWLGGPPPGNSDALVAEMVAGGKDLQEKVRQRLQDKKVGSDGVSEAVLSDALRHGGLEVTPDRAAGALASLTPAGRSAISQHELLSVWDASESPPMADAEARIKEVAAAADAIVFAVDGTGQSLRCSALAASLLQEEGVRAKARCALWLSSEACSSVARGAGAPFSECAVQVSALLASAAASLGVPASQVALASAAPPPPALAGGLGELAGGVSAAAESRSLNPLLAKVLSHASGARDGAAGAPGGGAAAAFNAGLSALAAAARGALSEGDGWGAAASGFASSLEALRVGAGGRARVPGGGGGGGELGPSVAEQADKLLARITAQRRPKPSLSQGGRAPFRGGRAQAGFEALAPQGVGGGPGAADPPPPPAFGSDEWYACQKTHITDWGGRFVGVGAHRHWLSACEAGDGPVRKGAVGGPRDVPLPVGMRGSVLVFGFVLCEWEVTVGRLLVATGEEGPDGDPVRTPVERAVFKLFPVGSSYSWFAKARLREAKGSPQEALLHLARAVDDRLRLGDQAQRSARATDAAALFGLRDEAVKAFLREHMAPVSTKTRSEADDLRRKGRAERAASRGGERMKTAEGELGDMEGAARERREAVEALRASEVKTVFTPRLKKDRRGGEEEVPTAEERERHERDRRAQFLRACQISLLAHRWGGGGAAGGA